MSKKGKRKTTGSGITDTAYVRCSDCGKGVFAPRKSELVETGKCMVCRRLDRTCLRCGFVGKSEAGLATHKRRSQQCT